MVATFKDKLEKTESPFEHMKTRLIQLEAKLQTAQIRTQEFQLSFEEFLGRLEDIEKLAAQQQPVSAVYGTLKQQKKMSEVKIA